MAVHNDADDWASSCCEGMVSRLHAYQRNTPYDPLAVSTQRNGATRTVWGVRLLSKRQLITREEMAGRRRKSRLPSVSTRWCVNTTDHSRGDMNRPGFLRDSTTMNH